MGNYVSQSEWDAISRMKFTPTELRLDRLEREYLFATAKAKVIREKFIADGDEECAALAWGWYVVIRDRWQSVRRMQRWIEAGKRADRIAARDAARDAQSSRLHTMLMALAPEGYSE